jgi:hypothetical protein
MQDKSRCNSFVIQEHPTGAEPTIERSRSAKAKGDLAAGFAAAGKAPGVRSRVPYSPLFSVKMGRVLTLHDHENEFKEMKR